MVTITIMPILLGLFVLNFTNTISLSFDQFSPKSYFSGPSSLMPISNSPFTIMIPGITIPVSGTLYWAFAMLISAIWHEFGHGIAAANYNVTLLHSGLFIYLILPGAYVSLRASELKMKKPLHRLAIIAAGPWHNITLALVSKSILENLPYLLSWGYQYLKFLAVGSVIVQEVTYGSELSAVLQRGSVIRSINDVPLTGGIAHYHNILDQVIHDPRLLPLRCVDVSQHASSCCSTIDIKQNAPKYCIWDAESLQNYRLVEHTGYTNIIPNKCGDMNANFSNGIICRTSEDCNGQSCMGPFVPSYERVLHLIISPSTSPTKNHSITYIGEVNTFQSMVTVGELLPKYPYLPISFPYVTEIAFSTFQPDPNLDPALVNTLGLAEEEVTYGRKEKYGYKGISHNGKRYVLRGGSSKSDKTLYATPLHFAVVCGNLTMIKRLLAAGADPSIKCGAGVDAFELAAVNCNKNIADILEEF
ncbi:Membrane-bound transcription factor site-2 protease [Boothiomyces sp. JEL0866]|nr:Membrane-bound transcription factor site-2 protease [Boothiomyces sp. JEL0866]